MAIISKISAQKRPGRYNIFIDGQYSFSASEKTVAEFVLLKGKEISDQEIDQIKQFDLDAKASDLAARFLSYEPRSIFEVLQYLKKHDITDEAAQSAVKQLNELGFLDDQAYSELFIKNDLRVGSDGQRTLSHKLKNKGVDSAIIEEELAKIDDDDWLEVANRVIKSMKNKVGRLSEREIKQKIKSKLMQHGFESTIINRVIDQLDWTDNEDGQIEALTKQGIKAYKKFKNLDAATRKFKIKRYLYTHGFSTDEINSFLGGEIISLEELEEY